MKRTPLKRGTKQMKRTRLRVAGHSETADLKAEIQRLVRLIVTHRDGGCILRQVRGCGNTAYVQDEKVVSETVIQADHLITRANSATYADTRLIVCLCRGCHGWKKWNEKEYDRLVRNIITTDRVALWDRCQDERYRSTTRTGAYDWKVHIISLKQELKKYT